MSVKTVEGTNYLFIEAGGFDVKKGPNWKAPLIVFKKTNG